MCNGSCYLSEKLKQVDEQGSKKFPNSVEKKPNINLPILLQSRNDSPFLGIFDLNNRPFIEVSNIYISSYSSEIFHPPQTRSFLI